MAVRRQQHQQVHVEAVGRLQLSVRRQLQHAVRHQRHVLVVRRALIVEETVRVITVTVDSRLTLPLMTQPADVRLCC